MTSCITSLSVDLELSTFVDLEPSTYVDLVVELSNYYTFFFIFSRSRTVYLCYVL